MVESVHAIVARLRAQRAADELLRKSAEEVQHAPVTVPVTIDHVTPVAAAVAGTLTHLVTMQINGTTIEFNAEQSEFIRLASNLDDPTPVILSGPAGTGKTTTMGGVVQMIQDKYALPGIMWGHKHIPDGMPGLAFVSFTRRATRNLRKRLPKELQACAVTVHKLLEYVPVESMVENEKGKMVRKFRYEPSRTKFRKLPAGLRAVIVDEMSQLGSVLNAQFEEALPHGCKIIYLGDMAQIIPVMDISAVSKYLCKVPTVELTHVYRQALESPILRFATEIRKGIPRPLSKALTEEGAGSSLRFVLYPKKFSESMAMRQLELFMEHEFNSGNYNPADDMVLVPMNKLERVSSEALNKFIATMLARREDREVYEVIAGFQKHYFSVGDFCTLDKEDCIIEEIKRNPVYGASGGIPYQKHSKTLNYWGIETAARKQYSKEELEVMSAEMEANMLLASTMAITGEDGQRKQTCSHSIKLRMEEDDSVMWVDGVGQINNLALRYAGSIHRAQGSEAERVYLLLHDSHNFMLNRELLYTAVTRAKKDLVIVCEKSSFVEGVYRQAIPGNTLQEKARTLRLKLKMSGRVNVEEI